MGGWAKKTRLRWRWREFRFETLYTTPEILLVEEKTFGDIGDNLVTMDGTEDSKALCFIEHDDVYLVAGGYERACWLKLLGKVQNSISNLGASSEALKGCQLPILQFQENSWDFQLPDVVRPLAKTSVGTIAVIARRLGMRWKEFDPIHGIMRAEGNGQTIIATTIRSLGTVIQYNSWDRRRSQERYIPVMEADRLGFGIISSMYIFLDGLCLGTREQVLATLRNLEPSGHCVAILQTFYKQDPNYNLRMGSLVAILADMIRPKKMILTQVPAPCDNALGFTQDSHGRYVFRKFLEEYCKSREVGSETKWVLQGIQTYSVFFQEKTPTGVVNQRVQPPDLLQDYQTFHSYSPFKEGDLEVAHCTSSTTISH
jgi:hypothetical protein